MAQPLPRQVQAPLFTPIVTSNSELNRVQNALGALLNKLLLSPFAPGNFEFLEVDLVQGVNKIAHGLGRAADGFWNWEDTGGGVYLRSQQRENPKPEKTFWLELVTLTEARVRLFLLTGLEGSNAGL